MQGSHSWQLLSILSGLPLLLSILSGLLETARGPGLYVILSQKQREVAREVANLYMFANLALFLSDEGKFNAQKLHADHAENSRAFHAVQRFCTQIHPLLLTPSLPLTLLRSKIHSM